MTNTRDLLFAVGTVALLAFGSFMSGPASAQSVEQFYKGKQMRMMIGFTAGGGYDVYARLAAKHMRQFIPGHPNIISQNKTGGGSTVLALWMDKVAPRDGSVLATIGQALPLTQILWPKRAKSDIGRLIAIGNSNAGNSVFLVWHAKNIKTWKDLQKTEVIIGATSERSISVIMPRAANSVLGTKFRIITGFRGGSRINLAIERGEVEGRTNAWASIKATTPHLLKKNLITIPIQYGFKREPEIANVPLISELAPNEAGRRVLQTLSALVEVGRPIFTTEGVPADRVKALRAAFDKAVASKEYQATIKKAKLESITRTGAQLEEVVKSILQTPPDQVKLIRAAVTKGATFKCTAVVKDKKLCSSGKKKKKKKKS